MKKIITVLVFMIMMSSYSFAFAEEKSEVEYKNMVETEIVGYAHSSKGTVCTFGYGYSVPLKINYNDSYKTGLGGKIAIDEFVLIDGVPTLKVTINSDKGIDQASVRTTIRCYTSKDAYVDIESESISILISNGTTNMKDEPLSGIKAEEFFKKNMIQYIEVWIDECDYLEK